ncbi:MAG: helix-turn-helix domain-containing protein [Pseudomonadota bacterium]
MNANSNVGQVELGKYLVQIREGAGIKQAELARMITWSPAVLSRVESGDRPLALEELQAILTTIGSPDAARLQVALQREWSVVPRPSLDHPDQDILWNAEQVAKKLVALREQPDVRNAFERRLAEYVKEIQNTADMLIKRDHQVAFIGSIGIGKSTAICRLAKLEVEGQDGAPNVPVLEAGAGGITICEVHLRTGPSYGLMIEPCGDDEIRADVTDFAEYLLKKDGGNANEQEVGGDSQGISKEIERAVRNMSGLKIRREKTGDGKMARRDDAKILAEQQGSVRELVVEILARMELHKRDRRDIWYDSSCGKSHLNWLKDIFEEVNNGRHPEFTLPRRIEVVVPTPLLGTSEFSVRIIDTKGIDRTAARADLEVHLDEPHTIAVLCSGFNNAPAAETRLLLERSIEAGVRTLGSHSSLLILPRTSEALAVKDESGIRVETVDEGYELKGEQVEMSLQPLGLNEYAVCFFNSHQDDPSLLRKFLIERVMAVRQTFRNRLEQITQNARSLLLNYEQEQVQEVIRHSATMFQSWIKQNSELRRLKGSVHVQDSLMGQLDKAYASTIRATIRREGEWSNLSYSYHLGYGARRVAVRSLRKSVEGFTELCKTMVGNPEFVDAIDLINQAERVLLTSYEDLLRKVQLMGQTSFRDELKLDSNFWAKCESEWGQGSGYRDRVTDHHTDWFVAEQRQQLDDELQQLMQREWADVLNKLSSLFDTE